METLSWVLAWKVHFIYRQIFCRYANSKSNPRLVSYIEELYSERRIMYATKVNHVRPRLLSNYFLWCGWLGSAFILKSSAKKPLEEIVIKKVKTKSQGSSRQSANSGKSGFLEFLRYEYLLKSSLVCNMEHSYIKLKSSVKIWEFLKPRSLVFLNLDQPSVNLSTLRSLHKLNF